MASTPRILVLFLAGLAALGAQRIAHAQDVTIYRCIDAKGHLTLRDTPCAKDQKQETRTMTRPQDAPHKPAAHAAPVVAEAPATHHAEDTYAGTRETYLAPPRPMYECITPDGVNYTSDTSDGNPRWVPLWTLGYPNYRIGSQLAGPNWIGPSGYGTYVRDTCYMLPPADVCARTRDRRDEVRTRFFNAQPSERDVLRVEERSLNARLDNDCGGQ